VQHAHASGDDQPEHPDHHVGDDIVAELMAEHRDPVRREQQQGRNREVRGVPQVIVAIAKNVLRRDRDEATERERPERAPLRLHEER
jgi:hypothetical protein